MHLSCQTVFFNELRLVDEDAIHRLVLMVIGYVGE